MDFTIREIEEGDAEIANQWLEQWKNRQPLLLTMYPTTGLVLVNENEEEVYMAFVWMTNSKLVQVGFITRNPNVKNLPKDTRLSFLHDVIKYCYESGAEHIATWTDNKFLVDDFKKLGFYETSNQVSELIIYKLI